MPKKQTAARPGSEESEPEESERRPGQSLAKPRPTAHSDPCAAGTGGHGAAFLSARRVARHVLNISGRSLRGGLHPAGERAPRCSTRISSEPTLRVSEARNIPCWRAPRAQGGNPRGPQIAHPRPDSPAPGRLDHLGTRAGATHGRFLPAAMPPPAPTRDQHSHPLTGPLHRG